MASISSLEFIQSGEGQPFLRVLDQSLLPHEIAYIDCAVKEDVFNVIKTMKVRGAPAIGAAGGFAIALEALRLQQEHGKVKYSTLLEAKEYIDRQVALLTLRGCSDMDRHSARPTAVNLSWATGVVLSRGLRDGEVDVKEIVQAAKMIFEEDIKTNRMLGDNGAAHILDRRGKSGTIRLLHHCNTGFLATCGHGTALGVCYSLCERVGRENTMVYVDETRPRLQGASLTCFELRHRGVPHKLITDGMSGHIMKSISVDAVLIGCDRVAANGDVANKIGTYNLAIVARYHKVPVYCCMPSSTLDLSCKTGADIVIEERDASEVTMVNGKLICPDGTETCNPAFDVTPAELITAFITE
ncbi:Translation initiation factor eIF-2B subunit delta, putative [Perkinsus marinus ATCC 50983]|uniref:Translation initiation factor eIF-2B subunit delta, putative n=1 Tax=Perkinsus marinus (strain ATCC 50983 / TXsc) TaxID=423536 RepID=C5M0W0_PERM5|nr:Translation initiation factor eIF-2B subunit delta, putative [Perkinsus marinus ATCC 50983]EEQ97468.1 Translation initiation factor eIF-2B subunit delta, putative [Perkinsus marinus ATCC 50983]|eukprot:XP_002764751.1 Translation initiation factor eIF-2B subunit delta, putative [Perkinsus marinus ATCC 50983]